jgi:hypothetical protein
MIFNNRELAVITILTFFFLFSFTKSSIRNSLKSLVKSLFSLKILSTFISNIILGGLFFLHNQ